MPKSDSNTRDRASRLVELRREATVAFGCSNPPTTAEQHLVECWATLKLGFEVLSARLVGGSAVDAVELIKLNEALSQYMPPRKQHEVNRLEVVFVDSEERKVSLRQENELLQKTVNELKAEIRKLRGEPEPTLSVPDQAITPPPKQLPSPAKADEAAAMGWTSVLGGGACHWTAAGGYSRALGE
jgi:hypothetical protein